MVDRLVGKVLPTKREEGRFYNEMLCFPLHRLNAESALQILLGSRRWRPNQNAWIYAGNAQNRARNIQMKEEAYRVGAYWTPRIFFKMGASQAKIMRP